ncbi:hypothetical protein [Streptomyces sp. YIM 98790]|uniref:hypothetical protein n=1 Tax=Streptomyces sp. YIM 98790 TaxID=2689077 RepID=UPI00140E8C52|nr:hypothetical protein [Streptomyces sp. YIM 98790]
MPSNAQLHASPRRGGTAAGDARTGEIRVPLSLYEFDRHRGDIELVLSRGEAETLHAALGGLLDRPGRCVPAVPGRGLEESER